MSVSRIDQQYLTIFALFEYVLQYCIISNIITISDRSKNFTQYVILKYVTNLDCLFAKVSKCRTISSNI